MAAHRRMTIGDLVTRSHLRSQEYGAYEGRHDVLLGFFYEKIMPLSTDGARATVVLTYSTLSNLYSIPSSASFRFRASCLLNKRFSAARCCISVRGCKSQTSESHYWVGVTDSRADLVVLRLRDAIRGHNTPPAIRPYPELWMHFVFRNDLASQNVAREQIIVHRLRDNLCDGRRCKLDEPVVFRPACLHASRFNKPNWLPKQTHPLIPREAETRYLSELGEICAQLILEEAMRNPAEINYARF